MKITLEAILTHPGAFGLTTATPVQRAICRVADGLPLGDLALHEHVRQAIGLVEDLPLFPPPEMAILGGIRTGKSLLAAAIAFRCSQTCDVSKLRAGEVPRVSVVSTSVDTARVVFDHIVGSLTSKPTLRRTVIGDPTSDTVMVRHPTGIPVEVKVVAGSRAGASLVARWSAGCIFDEAPRMIGSGDGVVNYDDARAAVIGRLLPGAQLISVGSPWAPTGPIYERVVEHWGKPSPTLVIIKAPAHHLNPVYWTEQRMEDLRKRDPDVYRTDVLAEFADPESNLMPSVALEAATREGPLELSREWGLDYVAAMDPATRGNSWTLVIATKKAGKRIVALARQWTGSKTSPLSPDAVLREIGELCLRYGIAMVETDQFAADALRDLAERYQFGLSIRPVTQTSKIAMFEGLRLLLIEKKVELPNHPVLLGDLRAVRKRITQNGISIVLPKTRDGRHADFAPALALAFAQYVEDDGDAILPGTKEWIRHNEMLAKQNHIDKMAKKGQSDKAWWEG